MSLINKSILGLRYRSRLEEMYNVLSVCKTESKTSMIIHGAHIPHQRWASIRKSLLDLELIEYSLNDNFKPIFRLTNKGRECLDSIERALSYVGLRDQV